VLRDVVQAIKYSGYRSLTKPLAALMRRRCADMLAGAHALVPVPLHSRRERERGFNQASELAEGLGLPIVLALQRTRATAPQAELPASSRDANVRGAFEATRVCPALRALTVVLVDDVSTTGATLEACAGVLKDAGVTEVRAVTAARTISRPAAAASRQPLSVH
jgi:ComF family protein